MAKGDPPPDTTGEVPTWFMTYSDVVTLLMTFFILLLTFASSDPEHFEKVQISLSGAGGSTGFADPMLKDTKRDSFAARIRPKASRLSMEGSEIPPVDRDTASRSVDGELAGLENSEARDIVDEYRIIVSLNEFTSSDGELYPFGKQHLKILGRQLARNPFEAIFEVRDEANLDRAIACTHFLFQGMGLKPGKSAISWNPRSKANHDQMVIVVRRHIRKT